MIMSLERPYRMNIWKRNFITESFVAFESASASTLLVTYSIATRMYVFWFDGGLIGPTKLSA